MHNSGNIIIIIVWKIYQSLYREMLDKENYNLLEEIDVWLLEEYPEWKMANCVINLVRALKDLNQFYGETRTRSRRQILINSNLSCFGANSRTNGGNIWKRRTSRRLMAERRELIRNVDLNSNYLSIRKM